jgi:hypothetical protein
LAESGVHNAGFSTRETETILSSWQLLTHVDIIRNSVGALLGFMEETVTNLGAHRSFAFTIDYHGQTLDRLA